MIDERLRQLREENRLTQSELAKRLGITRSSVNAWEMGISVPSTQYIVELAMLYRVSTDYLLGQDKRVTLDISGLSEADIDIIYQLVRHLRQLRQGEGQ
ncbi:MAG: helix-turn-helix transcriptional regulator [Oscillospiraceae bacterium]|jgi:transcriptional regulator with XRE-family HTH domain|nr:helix-turn-helix transcriptional regulator [Oscillospiraceae bacterium]